MTCCEKQEFLGSIFLFGVVLYITLFVCGSLVWQISLNNYTKLKAADFYQCAIIEPVKESVLEDPEPSNAELSNAEESDVPVILPIVARLSGYIFN